MNYTPEWLKSFRKERKLTQAALAKKLGLSKEMVNKMEAGTKSISELTIRKLSEIINEQSSYSEVKIPLITLEVAAGFGNDNFSINKEDIQAEYMVPDFRGIDFMIRVKGDSMVPKFNSGDIVACRIIKDPSYIQWNKPYVIATKDQGLLCKRLIESEKPDCISIVSDNKEYPPFNIPSGEIIAYALVIGTIRLE